MARMYKIILMHILQAVKTDIPCENINLFSRPLQLNNRNLWEA